MGCCDFPVFFLCFLFFAALLYLRWNPINHSDLNDFRCGVLILLSGCAAMTCLSSA